MPDTPPLRIALLGVFSILIGVLACGSPTAERLGAANPASQTSDPTRVERRDQVGVLEFVISAARTLSRRDTVTFVLTVRNGSNDEVPFDVAHPIPVDFQVLDSTGAIVWSTANASEYGGVEEGQKIPANGSRRFEQLWTPSIGSRDVLPLGTYSVRAVVWERRGDIRIPAVQFTISAE